MITPLDLDTLKRLAEHSANPSISLYIPTHLKGREIEQNPIRFKNALAEAEGKLRDAGVRDTEIDDLLKQPKTRVDDRAFWAHQGSGLGVFVANGVYEEVRMSAEAPVRVRVGERFHVTPLVTTSVGEITFYLLALSENEARLFEMSRLGAEPIELPERCPRSMKDANWFLDRETAQRDGDHSHNQEEDRKRFLRELSEGVAAVTDGRPVVLAAVNELAAMYRHEADHKVAEEWVHGNPDDISVTDLHRRGLEATESTRERRRKAIYDNWRESLAHGKGTEGIVDSLLAAEYGRVGILLVGSTDPIWGTFDPDEGEVIVYDERGEDHRNLMDHAIRATLKHSGRVIQLENLGAEAAAILRY